MYKLAYQTLKKNIALFGSYVVLLVVVEQFFEINSDVSFVLGAILALYTHRMILLDENYAAADFFKRHGPNGQKPPMLSFVGTVFPAVAIGADRSLKTAFQRGKCRFWKTLGRLAIGPFAFTLLGTVGVIVIIGYLEEAGLNVTRASVDIPLAVLAYCINFGSILLAVTALSMAYLEVGKTLDRGINHDGRTTDRAD